MPNADEKPQYKIADRQHFVFVYSSSIKAKLRQTQTDLKNFVFHTCNKMVFRLVF